MADTDNATLKSQYDLIQQRTQQNLAYRKKKKEEKEKKQKENAKNNVETDSSIAFGISDDLELKLADPPSNHSAGISDALVDHLNQQIRELKDETGRLYKLLSERDHEVRQLRKKSDQQRVASAAVGSNMAGDAAALKIVELSKKIRELTAELESEKSKCKQWAKKCFDMENELQRNMAGDASSNVANRTASIYSEEASEKQNLQNELQSLQDRMRHTEQRCSEYRNQCQSLRQELKVAQKVLSNEVGEGANIQSLLNAPSGWRGRAQQIIALQKKVQELKGQVEGIQLGSRADFNLEDEFMASSAMSSASSRRSYGMDERQKEQLRRMDRERKETNERIAKELKALEQDHESVKNKWEASKARNKVLSTEIKSLKQQLTTLLEKGKHDDELIQALMSKQSQMNSLLDEQSAQQRDSEKAEEERRRQTLLRQQQESNVVEQLKAIVTEKEAKVKKLTEEINNMRITKSQMNGVQSLFEETPRWVVPGDSQRSLSAGNFREPPQITPRQNGVASARFAERGFSRQSTLHEENEGPPTERLTDRPATDRTVTDKPPSRPSSRKRSSGFLVDQAPSEEIREQYQEFKSLYQATEVERDRLRELITVLERRLAEATQEMLDSQTELQGQKRKNVQLEKQLGKAKVEQGPRPGGKKTSAGLSRSRVSLKDSLDLDDPYGSVSLEEVQTNLEIQRDENEALKMALQRTLKAKEEDLKLYNEIMEETKDVFLQGLKQYRQKPEN